MDPAGKGSYTLQKRCLDEHFLNILKKKIFTGTKLNLIIIPLIENDEPYVFHILKSFKNM